MTSIDDLPTPCLVLDLDAFESNLERMSRFTRERGVALRPHAKTHKCVDIALRQLDKGAIGISVATIAEAEMMAAADIRGLLITGEMVGEPKVSRLMRLVAEAPDTLVVIDNTDNVDQLQRAADAAGVRVQVLIDLDVATTERACVRKGRWRSRGISPGHRTSSRRGFAPTRATSRTSSASRITRRAHAAPWLEP